MKGTDIPDEELRAAEEFLEMISHGTLSPSDDIPMISKRSDLIRTVAWYGMIRAQGGKGRGRVERVALICTPGLTPTIYE